MNKLKPKSEFSKNVLTLMTGTTIAQAIPIAISPILTRLYTPEDFGIYSLYMGIVGFLAIIATARYEIAIILPKKDEEAVNILALSLLITLLLGIITFISLIFFKNKILIILNAKKLGNLIFFIPISLLLAGFIQTFNYWANRQKYFNIMAISKMSQSFIGGFFQLILGYINIIIKNGLILGNILGRFSMLFVLVKEFLWRDKYLIKYINKKNIILVMKKYKDFPLINSFHAFSDVIRTSGSIMLISSFFGSTVLGFYALSIRVLQVPINIIGSALGQVLYQKFSSIYNENKMLLPYVLKIEIYLLIIAAPIFFILYIIAPDLFSFVFGEKWRIAGEYTQILLPYLFMNFLVSPISQIPIILKKQKEFFYFSLIGNIGMPLIFFIAYKLSLNIKNTLLILSSFMVTLLLIILVWLFFILRKSSKIYEE